MEVFQVVHEMVASTLEALSLDFLQVFFGDDFKGFNVYYVIKCDICQIASVILSLLSDYQ